MNGSEIKEIIMQAKPGSIVPVHKVLNRVVEPTDYFAKLSDYGRKQHSILLESADIVPKYGEQSVGSSEPCLNVIGKGNSFEIRALNALGKKFLAFMKGDFDFCDRVEYGKDCIKGSLKPARKAVSEYERLKLKTHVDILRAVAFKFKPTLKPAVPYAGLFGVISYDFIDQFEQLPRNKKDLLKDADYEMNFYDNLFIMDHKKKETMLIANALVMDENKEGIYEECIRKIEGYEELMSESHVYAKRFPPKRGRIASDTSKREFVGIVKKMKEHIVAGDIFQAVPSRTIIADYNAEPLEIYKKLKNLNPSPYMFYLNTSDGILLGSSPEMCLSVKERKGKRIVEIRPIAGTKPRGFFGERIDKDLDSRYETELKLDEKELAEHTMLIDLARNDVARVSKPGTRIVDEPYIVEKYSHVQHLVSNVRGELKDDLDALHAYLASMNMGTLTGAPKVEAMKLLRIYEKNKRGFYGGAVAYLTPSGEFDSTIVIRAMRLKDKKACIRVGAGIVYDSIPEKEFEETENKAKACIRAIELAQGIEFGKGVGND